MTASAPESPSPVQTGEPAADPRARDRGLLANYFTVSKRRSARRGKNRYVGLAKLLLIGLATGLITSVVVWTQIAKNDKMFKLGAAQTLDIEQADLETLRVVNARLTGTSEEGRPYTVTFDSASQAGKESDLVLLTGPKADVVLQDESWIVLAAPKGRYHRAGRILELDDPVSLFHDSGLEFQTGRVVYNLATGDGVGYDPLYGHAPFGKVESQGFQIRDMGAVFQFTGKIRVVLYSAPGLAG